MKESTLNSEMFRLGLSPRHKGFYYISRVLMAAQRRGGAGTGERYRAALAFSGEEQRRAERCMRYAIRYAWDVSCGSIHELFPGTDVPPAPIEFVHAMLWRLDELPENGEAATNRLSRLR